MEQCEEAEKNAKKKQMVVYRTMSSDCSDQAEHRVGRHFAPPILGPFRLVSWILRKPCNDILGMPVVVRADI